MTSRIAIIGLTFGSAASFAFAHGPQIQVDVVGNQIVTRGVAADAPDYPILQPLTRAYSVDMTNIAGAWVSNYNTDDHTGPGFVILQDRFADGTQLRFDVLDAFKFWNGSTFVAAGGEQLQISRSSGAVFTNTADVTPIPGFDLINPVSNATSGQHREIRYTLLGDGASPLASSDDGVYLLKLELTNATSSGAATGVAPSLPFYMLFNKNVDTATSQAALNYVTTTLVPEPFNVAIAAGVACALATRGRIARKSGTRRGTNGRE